jgi:hypothetical protein
MATHNQLFQSKAKKKSTQDQKLAWISSTGYTTVTESNSTLGRDALHVAVELAQRSEIGFG